MNIESPDNPTDRMHPIEIAVMIFAVLVLVGFVALVLAA